MPDSGIQKTGLKSDRRLLMLEAAVKQHQYSKDALLEILHTAQELYGYLDKDLLLHISKLLRLPPSHVYGVATFYNLFKLRKPGTHIVTVCMGTACYVKGVENIVSTIEREFNLKRGGTTSDGRLSLFVTRCIGACAMAPNAIVDGEVIGKATAEDVLKRVKAVMEAEMVEAR
ncbi:MAG: NAD(P)H-dependent oxidoreductase subunit E [Thermoproteota archaeon]